MKKAFAALSFLGAIASSLEAATVAKWTFETSIPLATGASISGLAAEVGNGTASGLHASAVTAYSNPVGNGSAESFSANTWAIGDYYQFQTSLAVSSDIGLTWEQTRSSSGPASFTLWWSIDGINFSPALTYAVSATTWGSGSYTAGTAFSADLTSISGLDFANTAYFRLSAAAAPSAAGGTSRVDDFAVFSNYVPVPVPEPATWALFGAGVIGLGFVVRRKSK